MGLIILAICVVLFITNSLSSAVVGCLGCLLMVLFKVCTFEEAFSGFSSSIVLLMIGSMIVGIAMFRTGAAQIVGRYIVRWAHGSERAFMIVGCLIAGIMAMFLANTAVLAAFIPIIDSVCRTSENIKQRNIVLPIAYAVMFGGSCTLIGCTPQLTANGLMSKMIGIEMGMWDLTGPGLCLFAIFLIYISFVGYKRGKKIWGQNMDVDMGVDEEKRHSVLNPEYDKKRVITMFVIIFLMIISYAFSILPVAETAICAAILCIVTKCCKVEEITKEMSWDTIVFLATCLGLANALTTAKSGELIGKGVFFLLGDVQIPLIVFSVVVLLTLFISQFITNSTAIIIVLPIAISLCNSYGYNAMAFCIGITLAASIACCTPLAAAQITMTEVAGYKFMDYIKYGWILTLICYVGIVLFVPMFYPLV